MRGAFDAAVPPAPKCPTSQPLPRASRGDGRGLGTAGAGRDYDDVAVGAEPLDEATPTILVASLDMIITLKEEAGREKDAAVLPLLRAVRRQLAESEC